MKLIYAAVALLVLSLLAVPTVAAPCQTGLCPTPPAVVTAPVVVAPAILPLYGAGYVGYGGGDDETKELLRQLIAEIKALRADVQAIQPAPGDGPNVPPLTARAKGPDVFDVFKANCLSCHSGDKPKGDFALMNSEGKFLRLSPADRRTILDRIDGKGGGVMPPPGNGADGKPRKPLTPAEKASIKAALSEVAPIPAGKK